LGNPERAGSLGFQGDLKCRKPPNPRSRHNRSHPSHLSRRNHPNLRNRLRRRRKSRAEIRISTCPHRLRRETRQIRDQSRRSA